MIGSFAGENSSKRLHKVDEAARSSSGLGSSTRRNIKIKFKLDKLVMKQKNDKILNDRGNPNTFAAIQTENNQFIKY